MLFEKWPYTNLYNLNLDWIVGKIKELAGAIDTLPESVKAEVLAEIGTPYSTKNPPPYPVKTVNGQTGDVTVTAPVQSVNEQTGAVVVNALVLMEGGDTPGTLPPGWLDNYYNMGVRVLAGDPLEDGGYQTLYLLEKNDGVISWYKFTPPGGGGGGAVDSVNGKTGIVVLKTSDMQNDSGYITANDIPVKKVNGLTGEITVNAADMGEGTETPETMTDLVLHSLYNHGVRVLGCLPNEDGTFNSLYILEAVGNAIVGHKFTPPGGGGGGAVDSVNGKTGAVVLKTSDLQNDSGYITAAGAPVQSVNNQTGEVDIDAVVYTARVTPSLFDDGGTAVINVTGIKASDNPVAGIYTGTVSGATNPYNISNFRTIREDFSKIWKIETGDGNITVHVSGAILNEFYIGLEVVR